MTTDLMLAAYHLFACFGAMPALFRMSAIRG